MKKRVLILGAAGRDFHNFNILYRDNKRYEVRGFTATQIPNIEERTYPRKLAGKLYPNGIRIYPEEEMEKLIKKLRIDEVVFSYSDVSHEDVMHLASRAVAAGADFRLINAEKTMLKSPKKIISVCAVRTGSGKSQTTRKIASLLRKAGKKVVVVRHPMPYGHLTKQEVERFEEYEDMKKYNCTIEEREEYAHLIKKGIVVYAGVDYEKILRKAEREADIIIWDGGNNDTPFFKPDLEIVVADPLRAGHEMRYYPGEVNFRRASVIIINKVNSALEEDIKKIKDNAKRINPKAKIICANSKVMIEDGEEKPRKVLIVEDGPTVTHGEMGFGAGVIAARKYYPKAKIISPERFAKGSIAKVYEKYKHVKEVLPAMGYSKKQMRELEKTIDRSDADLVLIATPIDLKKLINIKKKAVRVYYELEEIGRTNLKKVMKSFL